MTTEYLSSGDDLILYDSETDTYYFNLEGYPNSLKREGLEQYIKMYEVMKEHASRKTE